jgi:uncharacterized protein
MKNYLEAWGQDAQNLVPTSFDSCLFHGGCPDGIGGAYPFWKLADGTITFLGVKHNEAYPKDLVRGKNVVIVDFSYSRDIMLELCLDAKSVLVLDHHDTAARSLKGLEMICKNCSYIFDLDRSGAQIAWDWCFPNSQRPWFIDIIADRDLWKWKIPNSKEIGMALHYLDFYKWEKMDELYKSENSNADIAQFVTQGTLLIQIANKDIAHAVATSVLCEFEGYTVRLTTCQASMRSDVGGELANLPDCQFAVIWRYAFAEDQWWISMRASKTCELQLNQIAEKFGGGGHPKACGFAIHGPNSQVRLSGEKNVARGDLWTYFKMLE